MIDFCFIMPLILRFFYEMCGVRINKKTDVNYLVTFLMRLMSTKAGTIQFELNKMRWCQKQMVLNF
jgi:Sec-independent protein secretion pathway component TatC